MSQAVFAKMVLDRLEHEEALEAEKAKEKGPGGGGIRVVLPSVPADPLLRPGQKPRPLRLLGQDPDGPLSDTTWTATKSPAPSGPAPTQPLAANPEDAFDPAELVEDFEHPICECCMGNGWVGTRTGSGW